jgi:hypothetical protein
LNSTTSTIDVSGTKTSNAIYNSNSSVISGGTGFSTIIGVQGGSSVNGDHSSIFGGRFNYIFGGNVNNTILGGNGSTLSGTSYGTIINSLNTKFESSGSTEFVSGIGLSGRTITEPLPLTTYVENLHTFRTISNEVQPEVSGDTFTYNLNSGSIADFVLTGVSTIDITNVRNGANFILKTRTDGGHTITWTSSGYTFLFAGGSDQPGNNKTDLWRFVVIGSVIYGELISDFS